MVKFPGRELLEISILLAVICGTIRKHWCKEREKLTQEMRSFIRSFDAAKQIADKPDVTV
jgi:hypothetical protein